MRHIHVSSGRIIEKLTQSMLSVVAVLKSELNATIRARITTMKSL
jgi:hypothetical protein